MKRFLLSNDDGVAAPGIRALAKVVAELGDYHIVAPDGNRSGYSSALTLDRPLYPAWLEDHVVSISGTPADCVHLAINGLMPEDPDMVISGINAGANLGDDVLYSGTVAAAIEGRFLGKPSLAVSLVNAHEFNDYAPAATIVAEMISRWGELNVPPRTVFNVNVPPRAREDIKGIQITRLGHRARCDDVQTFENPRGRLGYWIGVAGKEEDAGPGTDFNAIEEGYVSITPLQMDMTRYAAFDQISAWLEGF